MRHTPKDMTLKKWILSNSIVWGCVIVIFSWFFQDPLYAQCTLTDLADDLSKTDGTLKEFLDADKTNVSSWEVLYEAGEDIERADINSLTKVSEQLKANPSKTSQSLSDEIIASGGYKKWVEGLESNWLNDLPEGLRADIGSIDSELGKFFASKADDVRKELVEAWRLLDDAGVDEAIRKSVNHLTTVNRWADEGIELTFEAIEGGAKILNKNGDELGKLLKEGADDVLEISDDFIVDVASSASKKFDGITIKSNTGETFINAGFVKNADGTLGFVEDVSSYGSQLVQNTIKQRGALRKSMTGIKATEDAHHLIPVQLLKENDVVKKAVEAGFEFNTTKNGLAIEKFVKKTGAGRHGPHPKYTDQIRKFLNDWATDNPGFSPSDAKEILEATVDDVKDIINSTSGKINDLNLNLSN